MQVFVHLAALLSALPTSSLGSFSSCLRSFLHSNLCLAFVLSMATSMAKLFAGLVALVATLLMAAEVAAGQPLTMAEVMQAAKLAGLCTTNLLLCARSAKIAGGFDNENVVYSDSSIHTINDLQHNFFLESALVVGREMTLEVSLRDGAPKRAFMTASAAKSLPRLISSNAMNLLNHFGVSPSTDMATSVATAACLCGNGSLPGERMTCATSADAVKKFVTSELGSQVLVLSTTTPAAVGALGSPVTIMDVVMGSLAQGKTIVLCHALNFPSALHYCHRMTGTKVITATLKSVRSNSSDAIKAVGICHMDTSLWLSTHPAFRALHISHGDEACHWLVDSDTLYYPTAKKAAMLT